MCHIDAYVCFRVTLLELLSAQLQEEDSEECGIPPSVARFLASSFQKGCGAVLTLATGSASSDEVQIVNLTDVCLAGLWNYCCNIWRAFSYFLSP